MTLTDYTFVSGEQYKFSLTYVSGSVTSSDSYSIGIEAKKASLANVSTRNYADLQFPTSGTNSTVLTINDAAESEGVTFHQWIWINSSGALVFDDYVVKVVVTKVETKNVTYGSNYILPDNPTRIGYTFTGWYTAESGGTQVTSSTLMATASDHTLYAVWQAKTITVTFDKMMEVVQQQRKHLLMEYLETNLDIIRMERQNGEQQVNLEHGIERVIHY